MERWKEADNCPNLDERGSYRELQALYSGRFLPSRLHTYTPLYQLYYTKYTSSDMSRYAGGLYRQIRHKDGTITHHDPGLRPVIKMAHLTNINHCKIEHSVEPMNALSYTAPSITRRCVAAFCQRPQPPQHPLFLPVFIISLLDTSRHLLLFRVGADMRDRADRFCLSQLPQENITSLSAIEPPFDVFLPTVRIPISNVC